MEAEESCQRPEFKQHNQLEFNGETRILNHSVKNLLTTNWLLFILNSLSSSSPKAKHDINRAEDDLKKDERDSLTGNKFEHISPAIDFNRKINRGDEEIKQIMKDHSRHDNEHGALRVGVGESEF
jgi:hypothetical protein